MDSLVSKKVFINAHSFCSIVGVLNKVVTYDKHEIQDVSLKQTGKFPYEVQVPIQIVGQFLVKNRTTINLNTLQRMVKGD
jgi:hypothetical protein